MNQETLKETITKLMDISDRLYRSEDRCDIQDTISILVECRYTSLLLSNSDIQDSDMVDIEELSKLADVLWVLIRRTGGRKSPWEKSDYYGSPTLGRKVAINLNKRSKTHFYRLVTYRQWIEIWKQQNATESEPE